jgi:hypothetical protein
MLLEALEGSPDPEWNRKKGEGNESLQVCGGCL